MSAEVAFRPQGAGRQEFFAKSGFSDFDWHMNNTPTLMASRLVQYISDVSTVRMHVLNEFGRAPSREEIREMRREFQEYRRKMADWLTIEEWPEEAQQKAPQKAPEPKNPCVIEKPAVFWWKLPSNTAREVIRVCALAMDCTLEEVLGPKRVQRICVARHLAATILKARGNSYPQVARHLGRTDHSSSINSVEKFFDVVIRDPMAADVFDRIAPKEFRGIRTLEAFKELAA